MKRLILAIAPRGYFRTFAEGAVTFGYNRFSGELEPGFRRNGRTFFIKMSYLFRKSF